MNTVTNTPRFENNRLALVNGTLIFKKENISVRLSALQNKLLGCLVRDITQKPDIIQAIWPGAEGKAKGNNYNQLVFQTRRTLKRHGCPEGTLILSPGKGISLNANLLKPLSPALNADTSPLNDQGLMFIR
ncbi:hypothetical protein V6X42_23955 [Serratia marcescens]|uniref:hypothetical protein n=1 Tax=Serratia marcescens TaxID=615 RepID=UPI002FE68F46